MQESVNGIVLNVLKYSDKNSIAHVYTDRLGRRSVLVPQGATRGARMRNAAFMPLSIVEMQLRQMPRQEIATASDVQRLVPMTSIYTDPAKNAVAMFLSELLTRSIQESEQNQPMFDFLRASIEFLDATTDSVANFHLCFLVHFGAFLGIQPDVETYHKGAVFDSLEGVFTSGAMSGGEVIAGDKAEVVRQLLRITFANQHKYKFNRLQRGEILDGMLRYYALHNIPVRNMRSPEILKMLFV